MSLCMHVRKLPSGRYRWIVQHRGERRDGTADTKSAAILAGSQALVELGARHPNGIKATMGELLEAWQSIGLTAKGEPWSPTYAADVAAISTRLPTAFLNRPAASITPVLVAGLHRQLTKDGWTNYRIERAHNAISSAFRVGIRYGWATTNPCHDLSPPPRPRTDIRPPSHDVVRALYETTPERLRLFIHLAGSTGARLGELVALRWEDIDGDTVTIRRAAVYTPKSGLVVRDTTKTGRKGDRRLELDDDTLTLLDQHRTVQAANAAARLLPAPIYVFSHDAGVTPWRPGYAGLEYRRLRAKVPGAEHVRFHDLRHYVATTMLLDGDNPLDVAAQLGHANPQTTLRVYAHYLPGRGKESATRRAARLRPVPPTGETTTPM